MRSNSASFAAKCLTVVATPSDCTPRTNAAAMLAREQRVLRVALEVAARERRAVDVDGGRRAAPGTPSCAPRRRSARRCARRARRSTSRRARSRTARRRRHAVAAFAGEAGAAGAVRPVGHVDRRDPEPLARDRRPQPFTGEERGLLVESQVGDERGNVTRHGGPSGAGRRGSGQCSFWEQPRISASWHRSAVARMRSGGSGPPARIHCTVTCAERKPACNESRHRSPDRPARTR